MSQTTSTNNERPQPTKRADYRHFHRVETRWADNDAYHHVNNVVYYAFFDTAVNHFLITRGVLDVAKSPVVGLVAETRCVYFSPIAFPDVVHIGLRVAKLGTSSIRYEIGLFRNDEEMASAQGHFVHVYVTRETGRSTPIPDTFRAVLNELLV